MLPYPPTFLSRCSLSACAAVLLASAGFSGILHAEDAAVWLAKDARELQPKILLPDAKGAFDMELADAAGVSIGEKPAKGTDTKSLVFSGTQKMAFKTLSPYPLSSEAFKVSLVVKPAEMAGEEDGTILRHGTQWELRYLPKKEAVIFVVWHDVNVFTEVSLPMKPDAWHQIEAGMKNGTMTLAVDSEDTEKPLKDSMRAEAKPVALILGATRQALGETTGFRPFAGSIADIKITQE